MQAPRQTDGRELQRTIEERVRRGGDRRLHLRQRQVPPVARQRPDRVRDGRLEEEGRLQQMWVLSFRFLEFRCFKRNF